MTPLPQSERTSRAPGCRNIERFTSVGVHCYALLMATVEDVGPDWLTRAPDLLAPQGRLACWFTEPAGVLARFTEPTRASQDDVRWLLGPALEAALCRFPEQRALPFVLDLGHITAREPSIRKLLLSNAGKLRHRFSRTLVVTPRGDGPLAAMALQAGAALLRGVGVQIEFVPSLERALERAGLRLAQRA